MPKKEEDTDSSNIFGGGNNEKIIEGFFLLLLNARNSPSLFMLKILFSLPPLLDLGEGCPEGASVITALASGTREREREKQSPHNQGTVNHKTANHPTVNQRTLA